MRRRVALRRGRVRQQGDSSQHGQHGGGERPNSKWQGRRRAGAHAAASLQLPASAMESIEGGAFHTRHFALGNQRYEL